VGCATLKGLVAQGCGHVIRLSTGPAGLLVCHVAVW
jgi:hypothetical protein